MRGQQDIEHLIEMMARLPGLGPRSARRAVLQLIRKCDAQMKPLAKLMQQVADNARQCCHCGNIGTSETCDICADPRRSNGQICVVEDVADLWALERSGAFKGRYHVLGGTLSALDQVGPQDLHIPELVARVQSEAVTEVILALNATVEGQTTAHYISDQLEGRVHLTSLARGIPLGGELDYLDDGTISTALSARKSV